MITDTIQLCLPHAIFGGKTTIKHYQRCSACRRL